MKIIFSGKVSDMFGATVYDDSGSEIMDYHGYVPSGLGVGDGDYMEFEVDVETGNIFNWRPLTVEDIRIAFGQDDDDDLLDDDDDLLDRRDDY